MRAILLSVDVGDGKLSVVGIGGAAERLVVIRERVVQSELGTLDVAQQVPGGRFVRVSIEGLLSAGEGAVTVAACQAHFAESHEHFAVAGCELHGFFHFFDGQIGGSALPERFGVSRASAFVDRTLANGGAEERFGFLVSTLFERVGAVQRHLAGREQFFAGRIPLHESAADLRREREQEQKRSKPPDGQRCGVL